MSLSNFNRTLVDHEYNFEGINVIQTVFTVMFVIMNTFLASLISDNRELNFFMTIVTWFLVMASIITTSFHFDELSLQASTVIFISVLYVCIFVPGFMLITNTINEEILAEAKLSYMNRDNFKRMFDALQEGIIVIQGDTISMMNDLSNKVLSEMTGLANFFANRDVYGDKDLENLIDKKLFFLFQNTGSKEGGTKTKKSRKKKKGGRGGSSDVSNHTSGSEHI